MQPIKKIQKNPISFCGPYFRIYFFICLIFYISYENKNTRQTVLFAELAFTISGIVPNDFLFVYLLACLFG